MDNAILQTVCYGTSKANILGIQLGMNQVKIGETSYDAFVDGGKFSPWATGDLGGGANGPAHSTNPYYNTASDLADPSFASLTWNGTSGFITARDEPTIVGYYPVSRFGTSIVATNWLNTGQDLFLGSFTWGYNRGVPNAGNPTSTTVKLQKS